MRTAHSCLAILLASGGMMFGADAFANCDAGQPFTSLAVGHAPTMWLRGAIPIRELGDIEDYVTNVNNSPHQAALMEKTGPGNDCTQSFAFPACSELRIKSNGAPGTLSMTLLDPTQAKPLINSLKLMPMRSSSSPSSSIDYLISETWPPAPGASNITFFVYLRDEASSQNGSLTSTAIAKHYQIEAFDSNDHDCTKFRPDQNGIIKKSPSTTMQPQETDTTHGHEGGN